MGMTCGSKTLSIRRATGIAAIFAFLGTMTASYGVVHTYAFSIVAHVYLDVFRKTVAGVTAPHGCSAIEYGIRLNAIIEDIYNFVLKLGDS